MGHFLIIQIPFYEFLHILRWLILSWLQIKYMTITLGQTHDHRQFLASLTSTCVDQTDSYFACRALIQSLNTAAM